MPEARGHPERGLRVPYVLGRALGEQAQQILYAQRVRAALPTPKTCPTVRPVCGSVGLRLNALKAGIVFFFFSRDFAYVRLQTGAKQAQKKKKKKEATGYFSCHRVTSHTEEMNNIRKTDPGYQKSSVS